MNELVKYKSGEKQDLKQHEIKENVSIKDKLGVNFFPH